MIEKIRPINLPKIKPMETESVPKKQSLKEWAMAGGGVPTQYKGREHVWHGKVKRFAEGGGVHMGGGGKVVKGLMGAFNEASNAADAAIIAATKTTKETAKPAKPVNYSPKVLESTAARFADKISAANPKLSDEEVAKKAMNQATKKLDWERTQKPALEKRYGALAKSSYAESNPQKQQNTPEVVKERIRKANEFLDQPTEPWTPPRPELQAFDRSAIKDALEGFPGVEQSRFPRDTPSRANIEHVEGLYTDPVNRALIEKQIKRGLPLGGESFYASLYPVKQAVLEAGMPPEKFEKWIHSLAPASARNSIMNEMAAGQFLRDMNARGIKLTEENVAREMALYKEKFGIGLPLMPLHREGVAKVLEGGQNLRDMSLANIPTNYKIPTYGSQKAGDFAHSVVLDVHEAGGQTQGSRFHPYFNEQGGFGNTEYNAGEQGMLGIAKDLGIPGGMAQAGRWFGGGELTGLRSPRGDALDLLEKQVAFTLKQKGTQPNPANVRAEILRQIKTGEGDLLPYYRNEGMPDVRQTGLQRAEGGEVHKADGGKIAKGLMGALETASKAANAAMAAKKVLPRAESDANLAKFIEKSKIKNKAYHATNQNVKRFDPKADERTENKSNIAGWMTNDPEFANDFASQKFRYWKTAHRPWEEDPNVPQGANIMPVHLSIENPFYATDLIKNLSGKLNMDEANAVAKALGVGVDELLGDIPKVIKYKSSGSEREHMPRGFDLVKSTVATDAMKRLGHDGVIALENGSEVYAPFNATQIKSATGNRGTYNIEDADITKAEGGLIREKHFDDGGKAVADFAGAEDDGGSLDKAKLMSKLLADMAKEQGRTEANSLSKPRAITDLLNRGVIANNPLSAIVDMVNMGLVPLDILGSKLTGRDIKVSSDKPFLGSEHVKDLMNKYNVTSGEERPIMETALSFASPTAMITGAMKAPSAVTKVKEALTSSKITPLATEAKTAQAGKPTGATYATKQEGPFFRVSPTNLDTSAAKTRGTKEENGLQSSAPLGGGTEQSGREVPKFLSSEEVGRIIADPVANEPLNIAKKYTQDTQGVDFGVPQVPSSSLAKQSGIARTFDLAVQGSPEYKSAIFGAYGREMPDLMEKIGAKNYDDLMEKAYRQMAKETDEQFRRLPYNFSYHRAGEGNYNGAKDMASDVHGNKHLYVYQGGDKHDFLHNVDPQSGLNENEKFRAVHDLLGHAIYGNEFGPKGEEMAWAVHQQMYSPLARMAMTAETRGQNSVVNYSPLNAKLKETIAEYERLGNEARRRGDTKLAKEIAELKKQAYFGFEFAPNKAVLLPPEFMNPRFTGGVPDYLAAANQPTPGTSIQSPLTHFSNEPGLTFTDPRKYGTGIKGAEADRLMNYPGAVRDRSYFYMGEPGAVSPESGLGVNRYRGESSNLYDITQDPLNFQTLARETNRTPYTSKYNQGVTYPLQEANDIERLIKEYGYEGMANPKASKPAAIMFKETPIRRQARGGLASIK